MFNFIKRIVKAFGNESSWASLTGGRSGTTPLSGNLSDQMLLLNNKNWVYVCTDKIADTIAGIDFHIRKYNRAGDDEIIYDSKVELLLDKPNEYMTGRDLKYIIASHLELTGKAFLLKDQAKNPTKLYPLIPSSVTPVFDDATKTISKYKITTDKGVVEKPAEEIIYIKIPNVRNPYIGAGTLQHIADWVDLDSASTEFNRQFFVNGSSPSLFFKTEATSQEALELARQGYEMRYTGASNSHKVAFMPKGVELSGQGSTPKDMEFSEADLRMRDKILSAFGVPKSVVGITEIGTSRADAEAKNYVFLAFTIKPKVDRLIAYLNEYLLPSFTGSENIYFSYENFIPVNEELELRKLQTSLAGQSWLTINEARSQIGLPPITNGDVVYGSFASIPIGTVTETAKAQNTNVLKVKSIPVSIRKNEVKLNALDSLVDKIANVVKENADFDEIEHQKFITRATPYEKQIVGVLKKLDDQIQDEVLKNLENEKGLKDFIVKKALFDIDNAQKLFVGFSFPILNDLIKDEGTAQAERIGSETPFNPNNETIQKRVRRILELSGQSYTKTTLELLNRTLDEGVGNGESLAKLTNRVADVFNLSNKYRAEAVARTTVFSTANASAREAYKQSGVVKAVKWHTAEDEVVCEFCGPMNGKTIDIDSTFFDEGDTVRGRDGGVLQVQFDTIQDPPLHVNCRCFTNAVIEKNENSYEQDDNFFDELATILSKQNG